MLWLDEDALTEWQALRRSTPGSQARYSDAAVEMTLTLWHVFHLTPGRAEFFATSVLRLLARAPRVPDHTILTRRIRSLVKRQPKMVPHARCTW